MLISLFEFVCWLVVCVCEVDAVTAFRTILTRLVTDQIHSFM